MSWTRHTCSWHDKLIALRILNRQAKISLCIWKLNFFYLRPELRREGLIQFVEGHIPSVSLLHFKQIVFWSVIFLYIHLLWFMFSYDQSTRSANILCHWFSKYMLNINESMYSRIDQVKFVEAFKKLYLVHSWIPWPKWAYQ